MLIGPMEDVEPEGVPAFSDIYSDWQSRILTRLLLVCMMRQASTSAWSAGELAASASEPAEQGGGLEDLFACVAAPGRADRPGLGAGAEPGHDVPGGETAQQVGVVRVADVGEVFV
ncbi:hypothetical protein GCM10011608_54510 [Micromonospora sonchi]|uniref:Uncharacterized protein n=1 Tax=Micromonospora sonchi TaxID=1763543 RepID=A0A917U799_9ACTN|nr:hypothetical protein GCM10011608_54510 [Micromonospora sonchi]